MAFWRGCMILWCHSAKETKREGRFLQKVFYYLTLLDQINKSTSIQTSSQGRRTGASHLWPDQSCTTEGGRGGDRGRHTHNIHPRPYQSRTKEEEGETKTKSRRLFTLSIMSGRLVAASTVTSRSCSTPSISVRSWARTRSPTPPEPDELQGWRGTEDRWVEGDGDRGTRVMCGQKDGWRSERKGCM